MYYNIWEVVPFFYEEEFDWFRELYFFIIGKCITQLNRFIEELDEELEEIQQALKDQKEKDPLSEDSISQSEYISLSQLERRVKELLNKMRPLTTVFEEKELFHHESELRNFLNYIEDCREKVIKDHISYSFKVEGGREIVLNDLEDLPPEIKNDEELEAYLQTAISMLMEAQKAELEDENIESYEINLPEPLKITLGSKLIAYKTVNLSSKGYEFLYLLCFIKTGIRTLISLTFKFSLLNQLFDN